MMYGYASSPIAYRDTIIVPVGGRGKAVMAFNQPDGKVVWARHDFGNVYSSPILIDVAGLEQVVVLMDGALVGVNPVNVICSGRCPSRRITRSRSRRRSGAQVICSSCDRSTTPGPR